MNKLLCFLFLLSILAVPAHSQRGSMSLEACKEQIDSMLRARKGSFALAFKDLSSGQQLLISEHESFHAASTMKTPVMIEVYQQVAMGNLSLSDSIVLKNAFASIVDSSIYSLSPDDDSELELYKHIGEKRSISDLMYLMITVSSNFATNLLIERVGPQHIAGTLHKLGVNDIHVLRGVEDGKAYEQGLNNTVTAFDLMLLFEHLAKEEVVSPAASRDMIRILLDQHFNEIIPARLPAGVRVAHKTGWFKGVNHDSGIVFLPDGRSYVLVLLSKDVEDDKTAVNALAAVSEILYRYVAGIK